MEPIKRKVTFRFFNDEIDRLCLVIFRLNVIMSKCLNVYLWLFRLKIDRNEIDYVKSGAVSFSPHSFPFSIFYPSIDHASRISRFSWKARIKPNKTNDPSSCVRHFSENRFAKEIILIQTIRSLSGVERKEEEEEKRRERKKRRKKRRTIIS